MGYKDVAEALDAITEVDAYKLGHVNDFPAGTEVVFSNLTARGSRLNGVDHTVFCGLQAYLDRMERRWSAFFDLSDADLNELEVQYATFVRDLLGLSVSDAVRFDHFRALHGVGHLPVRIRAVREGQLVPIKVPYLTIENTDPRFFWLTNYLETTLSAELWLPITSATVSWRARRLLDDRARQTGVSPDEVDYQGHDFSFRGMEGVHAAAMSSLAHLTSFKGTDTLPAIRYVAHHYAGSDPTEVIGASVNATEHAVMTAEAREGEFDVFERLIRDNPKGVLSLVSDGYDLWNVITNYLPRLKKNILARDGKLIIRPDSGDPVKILMGDPDAPEGTPARIGVVDLLAEEFGTTVNTAGFKELDPHIGVIYGDGITYERADTITAALIEKGYTSTTVTLGFGSFTYQYQTRDTFGMAVKATWVRISGKGRDIFKDPVTDSGTKKSARGRLAVGTMMRGDLYLIEHAEPWQEDNQRLDVVFDNGERVRHQSFSDVRNTLRVANDVYDRYRDAR